MTIKTWFTRICLAATLAVFASSSSVFAKPTGSTTGPTPPVTKAKAAHQTGHKNKKAMTSKKVHAKDRTHHESKKAPPPPSLR